MTIQEFADALCVALAKRGARVRIRYSKATSIYLDAKYRDEIHAIRVSDHPPGKWWKSGKTATNVDIRKVSQRETAPEVIAASVVRLLKNGL